MCGRQPAGAGGSLKKGWTTSTAVSNEGWNTLKVIAQGSNFKFYVNGTLVWSGSDASFTTGKVGIGCYRNSTETMTFYIDYGQPGDHRSPPWIWTK